ncbi:MAG TPA: HD domain-containing phosphohydrolase [Gallionella sp.]|nr:HD domain-containing phosphohydrolase [Gallionella sp.]
MRRKSILRSVLNQDTCAGRLRHSQEHRLPPFDRTDTDGAQHHEWLDDSGYPQGLKGETILLEARILAVADTVEAMSAHRPYRPGFGIEVALAEITKQRGVHYDPRVVDACLCVIKDKGFVFK